MKKLISLLVLLSAVTGCSRIAFGLANYGTDMPDVTTIANLPYGKHPQQRMDMYSPKQTESQTVLVYFYGGGWNGGEKGNYRFVAHRFTKAGYHVVIPDYRKYPEVTFPAFVEDTAAAIAQVKKEFPNKRIVIMGHSAGAYNVVMAVADPKYLAAQGLKQSDIAGVIGVSGPYNFTPEKEQWKAVFNHMDDYTPMQANSYINRPLPPMLLLWGAEDSIVGEINTELLTKKLDEVNSPYSYKIYEDAGHFDIVGTLALHWEGQPPTEEDTLAFIEDLHQ